MSLADIVPFIICRLYQVHVLRTSKQELRNRAASTSCRAGEQVKVNIVYRSRTPVSG